MKYIQGFPDYQIDENGNVYSYKSGKWLLRKDWINKGGYHYIELCKDGKKYRKAIHVLVCEAFCDGWFKGALINHKDGNTHNNNYQNLEWCTQKHNIHESYKNSGVSAVRNFNKMQLLFPNGDASPVFIGQEKLKEYIKDKKIDVSFSYLIKARKSRGYILNII